MAREFLPPPEEPLVQPPPVPMEERFLDVPVEVYSEMPGAPPPVAPGELPNRRADIRAEVNLPPPPVVPPGGGGGNGPGDEDDQPFARGDHVELAERTLAWMRRRGAVTFHEGQVWQYRPDSGTWKPVYATLLEHWIGTYAGTSKVTTGNLSIKASDLKGGLRCITNALESDPDRPRFNDAPSGMAFRNGFVRVRNGQIDVIPHAPENLCRYGYDFDYDPRAPRAELAEFFDVLFGNCNEDEKAARELLLKQFAGACLMGQATTYQKCLVMWGGGGNGKSQVIEIIKGMFPNQSVTTCALPPNSWGDQFRLFGLVGRLLNVVGELPSQEVGSSDVFKGVVTGDVQNTAVKNKEDVVFRPIAGHLFATNTASVTHDYSDGYFDRFVILPLDHRIRESQSEKRDIGQQVVRNERPGIVAWAIEGLADLQRKGRYSVPGSANEKKEAWRDETDPLRSYFKQPENAEWIVSHFTIQTSNPKWSGARGCLSTVLFDHFCTWSKNRNHGAMSLSRFGKRLATSGSVLGFEHKKIGNVWYLSAEDLILAASVASAMRKSDAFTVRAPVPSQMGFTADVDGDNLAAYLRPIFDPFAH